MPIGKAILLRGKFTFGIIFKVLIIFLGVKSKNLFKNHAEKLLVSSTKGNTGHLLGAAGAVEAIICTLAVNKGIVPPTINYKVKDEECDLNVVPNKAVYKDIKVALSNSLGFGGHNATIVIKKYE